MRRFHCWLFLTFGFSSLLLAGDDQRLRAQIGHVSSVSGLFNSQGVTLGADRALGARISFENLLTKKLGLEVGLGTSQHDFTLAIFNGVRRASEFRMTPLTLAGNLHFGDSKRVDSFFGAGVAYVSIGDFSPSGSGENVSVDAELTWMAQYGLDIALGSKRQINSPSHRWMLGLSISYMDVDAQAGNMPLPIEAVGVYAGMVWRFR